VLHRYQLFLLASGELGTRLEFFADDDEEALENGSLLFEACSDVCSSYELWNGSQLLIRGRPAGAPTALQTLSEARQSQMLQMEESLHSSRWCITRSNRLADAIDTVRKDRP
jgi:hypothetical protein